MKVFVFHKVNLIHRYYDKLYKYLKEIQAFLSLGVYKVKVLFLFVRSQKNQNKF